MSKINATHLDIQLLPDHEDFNRTALHEAGHVLMCVMLCVPFEYATINKLGDSLGHVYVYSINTNPWKDLLIIASGMAAVASVCNSEVSIEGAESDAEKLLKIAKELETPHEDAKAIVLRVYHEARSILDKRTRALLIITYHLIKEKHLTYDQVLSILESNDE